MDISYFCNNNKSVMKRTILIILCVIGWLCVMAEDKAPQGGEIQNYF